MSEQTNKEKILLVLRESIKFGRETDFTYNNMFEKHKEVSLINNLNKTIKEKAELFNNMNETSHLFQTIYDCAKLALANMLEKKSYNYYSAELIMKFSSLEEVFKRKLRPTGIYINSDLRKPENKKVITKKVEEEESEFENTESSLTINDEDFEFAPLPTGKFIEQGLTGKELVRKTEKREELINTLRSTQFD